MYGFLILKNTLAGSSLLETPQALSYNGTQFFFNPMPRFEKDKLFYEDDEKIVLLDGVVFNIKELIGELNTSDWRQTFDAIYKADPVTFANRLRGSFCGAVLNKASDTLICFTNQSGEKPVYYTQQKEFFAAASHNNILIDALNNNGIAVTPNLQACRELLCTASNLHGNTPFEGIRRITAGKYMALSAGVCKEVRYHMFHNVPEHDMSLEECVDEMDRRFRKAVDRIFSKNEEYGYQGECDLSGGLDSRMATWVAHDLGYKNFLNVCYCQSGNIDNTTSKKIAKDIGNDYFFLPMDGGEILMDIDEVVDKFGGQVSYVVCTGANRAMKEIRRRNIGMCCTGLLGELHNAYWVEGDAHTPPAYTGNRYSSVAELTVPKEYSEEYENYEQMNLYEYSCLLWLSSAIVRQQSCEVTSPFIDVDFLEFAYRVPLKWRKDYLLTKTWMVTKYPQAAKYVWLTKRMPVDKAYYNKFYFPKLMDDARTLVVRCVNKALRTAHIDKQLTQRTDMNPFDNWFLTNERLRDFADSYFEENLSKIQDEKLKNDVIATYKSERGINKIQALNLIAVFKRYF